MGKITGFMEYERRADGSEAPAERIKNFDEFHPRLSRKDRIRQAARCMNCGVPFCQSGMSVGGMFTGCPLHNLIPEWNDELYNGSLQEALLRLTKTNSFPEFTGRVCPALCEAACTCSMHAALPGEPDGSVTVCNNELYIIEQGFQEGLVVPRAPKTRSGKTVAVVGSGPAGLAAADRLNRRGHTVTVLEREDRPGGLLMYGIPNMKLDKKVVDRRLRLMEQEGVRFITGADAGRTHTAEQLLSEYDAVVLCCGSKTPRDLNVPGRDAEGVHFAVDYLTEATKTVLGDLSDFRISAEGLHVVIVGGGDTGNDCVGTAIRQGCRSVTQLEMLKRPPLTRAADNPWPQWPRVLKTDYGQQEAIAAFGEDPRVYETTVKEILKDDNGRVRALVTVRLEEQLKDGRKVLGEVPGSEREIPCELLLIAAGFVGCESYVAEAFSLERGPRGTLNAENYRTSNPKVFTAGDCRRGQSLVVWAIREGRECAQAVDEYLMGYTNM